VKFQILIQADLNTIAPEPNERPDKARLQDTITSTGKGVALTA
jgi:hypothetical protein